MKRFQSQSIRQFVISIGCVLSVSAIGIFLYSLLGYKVIAFLLLLTVSILAMFLDILPVLTAAMLSALIWDYFFIPPRYTFSIGTAEDQLLLLMYFLVASVHAVLTSKIRNRDREIKAKEEREKSARFHTALLNSLSHELRTPITTILGSTDNLIENSRQLSEGNKSELLNEISVASVRLNQQVENLLNMSRLEAGVFTVKKDWCDVNDLVYKTLQRLEVNLQKHKVVVEIPEGYPLFKLDYGLMEQVMFNLLLNASQHTHIGTVSKIRASYRNDTLILVVEDNGNGFPTDEIDKAFDKFYRMKGSATGGTGLGLSIVKGFIEAHQGSIKLENASGSGCRFTIEIPTERYVNI